MIPVPRHLRDGHYQGAKALGVGQGYLYAHDYPGGVVPQDYLGVERQYYVPTDRGYEQHLSQRLAELRAILKSPAPPKSC